jgi:hypothetical protein
MGEGIRRHAHVTEPTGFVYQIVEVEEHVGVRRHRLAGIRALRDSQIEQVRNIRERPEFCPTVGRIEKIHGDVFVVTGNPRFAARHGDDIPAILLKQVSQHVAAGQSGGTCEKWGTLRRRHKLRRRGLVTVLGH